MLGSALWRESIHRQLFHNLWCREGNPGSTDYVAGLDWCASLLVHGTAYQYG